MESKVEVSASALVQRASPSYKSVTYLNYPVLWVIFIRYFLWLEHLNRCKSILRVGRAFILCGGPNRLAL